MKKKKQQINPRDIQVGDSILLGDHGRWTCKIKGDYSKKSREYRHSGGWFLVMDVGFTSSDFQKDDSHFWVELWHPGEDYWCSTVFYEDEQNEAEILDHLPCESK